MLNTTCKRTKPLLYEYQIRSMHDKPGCVFMHRGQQGDTHSMCVDLTFSQPLWLSRWVNWVCCVVSLHGKPFSSFSVQWRTCTLDHRLWQALLLCSYMYVHLTYNLASQSGKSLVYNLQVLQITIVMAQVNEIVHRPAGINDGWMNFLMHYCLPYYKESCEMWSFLSVAK